MLHPFPPGPGSVAPFQPPPSKESPPGPGWVHEIKHDGFAFDLIEHDGDDLRPLPIEYRKQRPEKLIHPARRSQTGIILNAPYVGDGAVIYKHVCTFGCEGIVSKGLGSRKRIGVASDMAGDPPFPPPWSVEETDACFTVRDADGMANVTGS